VFVVVDHDNDDDHHHHVYDIFDDDEVDDVAVDNENDLAGNSGALSIEIHRKTFICFQKALFLD